MSQAVVRAPRLTTTPSLACALVLLICVWLTLLLCQVLLGPRLGRPAAVLVSFALATVLVLPSRAAPVTIPTGPRAAVLGLGALAGFASYPAWIGLIAAMGTWLGLAPPASPPGRPDFLIAAASVGIAPVFEEILYREHILGALRPRFGAPVAVLLSSAAFAIAHVEPWAVLGTFLVGLGLGAVMCRFGSVAPCIGLHAGLNLAACLSA